MRKIIIYILLSALSFSGVAQNFDINALKTINVHRDKSLDPTFRFITNSVSPMTFATPVAFITYAILKKDSISKRNAINVCASLAMSGIITTVLKDVVKRNRPFVTYSFIQKETSGGGYSFPSGHTSSAFSIATSISMAYPKWYVIAPSFLWAGAVGYSRMDLGVHYPTDILAGAIVGAGSAFLSVKLNQWITYRHKTKKKHLRHE